MSKFTKAQLTKSFENQCQSICIVLCFQCNDVLIPSTLQDFGHTGKEKQVYKTLLITNQSLKPKTILSVAQQCKPSKLNRLCYFSTQFLFASP